MVGLSSRDEKADEEEVWGGGSDNVMPSVS